MPATDNLTLTLPPTEEPAMTATAQAPTAPTNAPDPFDPAALRLSGDAMAGLGVKKALLTVPVRKPDKAWFVRVHPDPDYSLQTAVLELKEEQGSEVYLIAPDMRAALADEPTLKPVALFPAVSRQGVTFLWPCKLPGADGRRCPWGESALQAADMAKAGWVRVTANMSLGAYEVHRATGAIPDPEWPDAPFKELLRTAFKGRLIDSPGHPVLRKLRGEV